MQGIDAVIFTGGEDISPSLYAYAADWHGIADEWDYNPARDVSDYILMDYCLDKDIPVLGLCRGMQLLGIISGASVIQDIPTFFAAQKVEYSFQHRNQKSTPDSYRDYAAHTVLISNPDTLLYDIYQASALDGCPSWHHQALLSVGETPLIASGYTMVNGIAMLEAIERADKTFALGLQFHPEAAVAKHLHGAENADTYMSYETGLLIFEKLMEAAN